MNFVSKKLSILLIFYFSLTSFACAMDKDDSFEEDAGNIEWTYMRGTFKRLAILQKEGNLDVLATVGISDNFNRIRRQFGELEEEKEEITKNIESEVIIKKGEFMECIKNKQPIITRLWSKSSKDTEIAECITELDNSMNEFHLAMRRSCPHFYELPKSPVGDKDTRIWSTERSFSSRAQKKIEALQTEGKLGLDKGARTLCNFNRADERVRDIKIEINNLRKELIDGDLLTSQRSCLKNLPKNKLIPAKDIEECWNKRE